MSPSNYPIHSGLHIKVKDPKWANVIELAIGSLAMNFVVNDQHDKSVLQELFRKSFQNAREHPNMIMMRFRDEFYDVNSQKPQTGHPTIYDMLDIDCHVISNALVEQVRFGMVMTHGLCYVLEFFHDSEVQKKNSKFSVKTVRILEIALNISGSYRAESADRVERGGTHVDSGARSPLCL